MYYNENTILYLDGNYVKATEAVVDLYSQTLHYGYGAFEGIRSYKTSSGTHVFKSHEHYERLKYSCEAVNIPFNYTVQELVDVTLELLEKNNISDAYIRPLVYCDPNMSLAKPKGTHIMIAAWDWGAYLGDKLVNLMISSYCRPHPKSIHVGAKISGHYINSILATNEAKDKGFDEGLLLDFEGYLAEGPGANLFFEKDNKLYTPQLGNILPGITRATIIEISKELGIEVIEGKFTPEQLFEADGAFYCGTAAEVIGIQSVNNRQFSKEWDQTLGKLLQVAYRCKVLKQEFNTIYSAV